MECLLGGVFMGCDRVLGVGVCRLMGSFGMGRSGWVTFERQSWDYCGWRRYGSGVVWVLAAPLSITITTAP